MVSFIVDRNAIHRRLINYLKNNGFDYICVDDEDKDVDIVRRSQLEKRVIITRDSDFITRKYEREASYGIVYIRQECRDIVVAFQNALKCIQSKKKVAIVDKKCDLKECK